MFSVELSRDDCHVRAPHDKRGWETVNDACVHQRTRDSVVGLTNANARIVDVRERADDIRGVNAGSEEPAVVLRDHIDDGAILQLGADGVEVGDGVDVLRRPGRGDHKN